MPGGRPDGSSAIGGLLKLAIWSVALINEAPIQRLAFAVQPRWRPVTEVGFVAAGTATNGADFALFARNSLLNRNTATRPVVVGFFVLPNRNISVGCCASKKLRSAHFIGVVAVLRFGSPLRVQIA